MSCSVYGCKNSLRGPNKTEGIAYYRIPKKPVQLRNAWIHFCAIKDKKNWDSARICSVHFPSEDKHWNLQHRLLCYSPTQSRKVRPGAIPTLNSPIPQKAPDKSREERAQKRSRKKLVMDILKTSLQNDAMDFQVDDGDDNNIAIKCEEGDDNTAIKCEEEDDDDAITWFLE